MPHTLLACDTHYSSHTWSIAVPYTQLQVYMPECSITVMSVTFYVQQNSHVYSVLCTPISIRLKYYIYYSTITKTIRKLHTREEQEVCYKCVTQAGGHTRGTGEACKDHWCKWTDDPGRCNWQKTRGKKTRSCSGEGEGCWYLNFETLFNYLTMKVLSMQVSFYSDGGVSKTIELTIVKYMPMVLFRRSSHYIDNKIWK